MSGHSLFVVGKIEALFHKFPLLHNYKLTKMPGPRSKIYLVGAGPGDPGLLTLKGRRVLQQADVVIYDYLANPLLLNYAPNAELINAGKRHGKHTISQDRINELIVEKALENKIVVRLKGGDPFIFGRGGEELANVVKACLPFEVIPGVSSAIGVPAYAGIPLTHRDHSSNVVFLTGTEHPEKPQMMIPWEAIAQIGTIVVMMGLTAMKNVMERLIKMGRDRQTPVAVIQWGTWPRQRSIHGTLETIAEQVKEKKMTAPVLTIIGDVCQFHQQYNWFEQQPLFGQHILVTRVETGASSLSEILMTAGAEVTPCPTISIEPPLAWTAFDQIAQNLQEMDWVIFTSANGIERCMARLRTLGKDGRVFGSCRIACVGNSSAKYLEQFFLIPDVVPSHFQSEGLLEALKSYDWEGQHVWLPQVEDARELLSETLTDWGGIVHSTPIYRNVLPTFDMHPIVTLLQEQQLNWITFTSSSTVKNFFELLPEEGKTALAQNPPKIACIGEITAETARQYQLSVDLIPEQQSIEGLANAISDVCASAKESSSPS